MDLVKKAASSAENATEAARLKALADCEAREVYAELLERAKALVPTDPRLSGPPRLFGDIFGWKVREWQDNDLTRYLVLGVRRNDLTSVTLTPQGRPSHRKTSTQQLLRTPMEHIEVHFRPLMSQEALVS